MDIESLHKCAKDVKDSPVCPGWTYLSGELEIASYFQTVHVVSSKLLTTQLYCHIKFSLLWNLWFLHC